MPSRTDRAAREVKRAHEHHERAVLSRTHEDLALAVEALIAATNELIAAVDRLERRDRR